MKKYELLLGIGLVALTFSGCSNGNSESQSDSFHEHTYSSEWAYDETYHWHAATCEHVNLVADKEEHIFDNWIIGKEATEYENGYKTGVCSICQYNKNETIYATGTIDKLNFKLRHDNLSYIVSSSSTSIEGSVVIPYFYNNLPVVYIDNNAFKDCTSLTSIVIPNSVTHIGDSAFYGCTSLTSIVIPNSVTSISEGAFDSCYSLIDVFYTGQRGEWNIIRIKDYNLYLTNANIEYNSEVNKLIEVVTDKYSYTLTNDNRVLNFKILDTLIASFDFEKELPGLTIFSLGNVAFSHCTSLTSINIPNGVTSIGSHAFSHCSSLTSITIPNGITSIGGGAFSGCSSLTSITIPNGVTSIGYNAFSSCTSLTSVAIPNSITYIDDYAFSGCSSLTSITIPNGITSIGGGAFSGCSSLTSIVIPNSITHIGDSAFFGCSSLTSIVIPNSVTHIGDSAFSFCTSLTSIAIPDSVTSIGDDAFYACSQLVIYCEASSKPINWSDRWNSSDRPVHWGVSLQ